MTGKDMLRIAATAGIHTKSPVIEVPAGVPALT
jgi:hypothetical protein